MLLVGWEIWKNAQLCGGRFTYPLDDAYIHLAMAKNWLRHGVIGANSEQYQALASSPLYTGIVTTLTAAFGPWEYYMLLVNLLACAGVLALSYRLLHLRLGMKPLMALAACQAAAFLSPLHILVVGGMEHAVQVLFLLLFLDEALKEDNADNSAAALWAFLASATRPECLFVLGPAMVFHYARTRSQGLLISWSLAAALPWLVYGLVNLAYGQSFLPDSLRLKSGDELDALRHGTGTYWLYMLGKKMTLLQAHSVLGWLFWGLAGLLLAALAGRGRAERAPGAVWLVSAILSAMLAHAILGKFGWVYRYENYLIFLGVLAGAGLVSTLAETRNDHVARRPGASLASALPLILLAAFLAWKAWGRLADTYMAGTVGGQNIHRHHRHMAGFFAQYYPGKPLLVHDIGMFGWLTDSRLVDVSGLSGGPILPLVRAGTLDSASLKPILHKERPVLAFLYPHIARPLATREWIYCGALSIRDNVSHPADSVLLYAFDPEEAQLLAERFRESQR